MHLSCRHQLLPTHLLGSSSEWSQIYPVSPRRDPSAPPPSRDASDSEALCKEATLRLGQFFADFGCMMRRFKLSRWREILQYVAFGGVLRGCALSQQGGALGHSLLPVSAGLCHRRSCSRLSSSQFLLVVRCICANMSSVVFFQDA